MKYEFKMNCDKNKPTSTQMTRAIFRWITAKDLNKLKISEDTTVNTPMGLLRGIQTGTESYHNLFKRLCRCDSCSLATLYLLYHKQTNIHTQTFTVMWLSIVKSSMDSPKEWDTSLGQSSKTPGSGTSGLQCG